MSSRRLLAALVFACTTVSVVSTLGAPLIPTIAVDRGISLDSAQWALTITLLAGSIGTPVIGRLGDGGRRYRVLMGTLSLVVIGSVIVALSSSFAVLLAGRALQGFGYGTVPLAIALAREHFNGAELRSAIGMLSISVGVGAGLGYPITGFIAQSFDYHAAFWFGATFSTAALAAAAWCVPRAPASAAAVKVDVAGAALLAAGLGALLLAISRASTWGWGSTVVLSLGAAGLVLLAVWAVVELRVDGPLLDLRLAALPQVLGANVTAVLLNMGMFSGMALICLLAQTPEDTGYGFGASLVVAGLLLLPLSIAGLISQPIAQRLTARLGLRRVLILGALAVAAAEVLLGLFHGHLWQMAATSFMLGIGVGTTFAAMPTLIVRSVPHNRTGSAMSLNQVLRTSGGALGSALAITILSAHTAAGAAFPGDHGYTWAFIWAGAACTLAAVATRLLVPDDRPERSPVRLEPAPASPPG